MYTNLPKAAKRHVRGGAATSNLGEAQPARSAPTERLREACTTPNRVLRKLCARSAPDVPQPLPERSEGVLLMYRTPAQTPSPGPNLQHIFTNVTGFLVLPP